MRLPLPKKRFGGGPKLTKGRAIVLLRLTLVVATGYLVLAQSPSFRFDLLTGVLVLAGLASNLPFIWLPRRLVESAKFGAVLVIVDTAWITAVLLSSGYLDVDFYVVYFFVLFLAATGESLGLMALGTCLVCGGYLYSVLISQGSASVWSTPTLVRLPFFFALAALYGFLADRVRRERTASRELLEISRRDPLTDLPNRRGLEEQLEQALRRASREGDRVAVLLIDLDHFKYVNDTYGHALGDRLLTSVADRMREHLRTTDSVGRFHRNDLEMPSRLGGDEFAVVLTGVKQVEDAGLVAERICRLIAEPVDTESVELAATASIGIALFDESRELPESDEEVAAVRHRLLMQADRALYQAKSEGRNTYRFHDEEMDREIGRRIAVARELRGVTERDELFVEYQPQVEIESGRIVGVEALVRWQHAERGRVPPDEFIAIAESSGQIGVIGEWVLRRVCRDAARWSERLDREAISVAVNLSALQFADPELVDRVLGTLRDSAVSPELLELELTEGVLLRATPAVEQRLHTLHDDWGIGISLDDFGRGYSSLEYLRRLPLDKLKVDRYFVSSIEEDADCRAIASAIVALARKLRLTAVAEGVETVGQLRFLRDEGCHQAQGFLFSPPVSAERLLELLLRHRGSLPRLAPRSAATA